MNLTIFLLALLSGVLNATWNFFSKKKASDFSVMITGVCVANLTVLPVTLLIIVTRGLDLHAIPFFIASGVIEGVDFLLLIKLYQGSDISMAYPVSRGTGVMFVAVLSTIIFGEHISELAVVGILMVLLGVFFFSFHRGRGLAQIWESVKAQKIAFLTGLAIVAYTLVDRAGAKYANPLVFFNAKELIAMSFVVPILFRGGHTLSHMRETMRKDGKYALIIGYGIICSYVLILLIYNIFTEAKTSYITPIRESSMVIGSILGFLFLKEKATPNKIAGILAIVLGVILIKAG